MPARRRLLVLALVPVTVLAAGCGEDGIELPGLGTDAPGATEAPAPEPTEAPAPEPTEAPAPEPTEAPAPAPTEAPAGTEPTEDDDGDGIGIGLILLIIAAVAAVIAAIAAMTRRGSSGATAAPATDPRRQMLSTAKWIHDQLSLEVLALPAAEAQRRWELERSRFDQLVIDLRAAAPSMSNPAAFETLAGAVANLKSSLDTAVRIRSTDDADPDFVREAVGTANQRRNELQQATYAAEQSL